MSSFAEATAMLIRAFGEVRALRDEIEELKRIREDAAFGAEDVESLRLRVDALQILLRDECADLRIAVYRALLGGSVSAEQRDELLESLDVAIEFLELYLEEFSKAAAAAGAIV